MSNTPDIKIMRERCVQCGDCLKLCPQSGPGVEFPVFTMDDETQSVRIENSASCFGCLTCVEFCRATAIIMTLDKKAAVDLPDLYPTRPANKII